MNTVTDNAGGQVVVYEALDGEVRVEARLERETVWLSLNQMAELFGRDKSMISRHLRNVFRSAELERTAKPTKSNSLTSTPSCPLATGSTPCAAPNSASGQRIRYEITW